MAITTFRLVSILDLVLRFIEGSLNQNIAAWQ